MSEWNPLDPNSFSRPDQLVVNHIDINLKVNFNEKKLSGKVIHSVERKADGITDFILDTSNLTIIEVKDTETGERLDFAVIKDDTIPAVLGNKLVIKLGDSTKKTYKVSICYETSPSSSGLQWLEPEQTAGKQYPYLFSQSEAIHGRSIYPCQDSPSVKASYAANITAGKGLTVLMSAVKTGTVPNPDGTFTHTFLQKVPIPSYLIAIVVGALENRKISDRIDVWSEKEFVDKAAFEFSEAETMLTTAEKLVGPYIWGRYDILVLPPSFPYGGMENPCLTFATPTLLAGDRSLADVIAHEISHSWTGNLVTNVNFEHFWLNEGFTVYVERLIDGEMFGEQFRQFKAIGGWKDLLDEISSQGETGPGTKLVVDLHLKDPDDYFSTVPYEKGFAFLYYLELLVGGREILTGFLRSYIEEFKYKSLDSDTWKKYFLNYFKNKTELQSVDFNTWFYSPGLPPFTPSYDQTMEQVCVDLSEKWMAAKEVADFEKFKIEDIKSLHSSQVVEFLTLIRQKTNLSEQALDFMAKIYGFNDVQNSEIKNAWLRLALQSKYKPAIQVALTFVVEQGRMKFLRPIYKALYDWEETRQLAIDTFLKHKNEMMGISRKVVAKELHLPE